MLKTETIDYYDGDTLLEAFYACDESHKTSKPVVMVAHDWSGRNEFACHKAKQLAELGYIGFAIDMFGKGKIGQTKEEKAALIQPFMQDRYQLRQRISAAYQTAKKLDKADAKQIAAIGFCFGGLCVLDLARSGADLKAVVSFHGLLQPPEQLASQPIKAKILALHGYNDPMVTPEHVMRFADEMTHAKVDWQMDIYGNVMHAFTNPQANDPGFGTVYNKNADHRSWIAMKEFLKESFDTHDYTR